MEQIIYQIWVLLDANACIIDVESTAIKKVEELKELGYIMIDDGKVNKSSHGYGETYGHAQVNYLLNVYGKPKRDEQRKCNYRFIDGEVIDVTDEEKIAFYPPVEAQHSELELLKQQQERTDAALQDLILMSLGGE